MQVKQSQATKQFLPVSPVLFQFHKNLCMWLYMSVHVCVCVCWLEQIFEGYTQNFPQGASIAFIIRKANVKEKKWIPEAMK